VAAFTLASPKPVATTSAAAAKRATVFMRKPYLSGFIVELELGDCRIRGVAERSLHLGAWAAEIMADLYTDSFSPTARSVWT
jgi:hypothetical protein